MAIELLIEAPAPQMFSWNYEAIKEAAVAKAKEYQGIIYGEADEAAMKRDRADLNRIINAIEDERKRIKKACMVPYETFEAQVKDVLQPLRSAVTSIDAGLSEIDRQYRKSKTDLMKSLYDKAFEGLEDLVPFDKTVQEEYFKKAYTDKKLEKAYTEKAESIRKDLETIQRDVEEIYKAPALHAYTGTFNLADAYAEVARLKKLDEAMEARRKAEEERKAKLEAVRIQREKEEELTKTSAPAPAPEIEPQPQKIAYEPPKVIAYGPIICYGTKEQLIGMGNYCRMNGIRCVRYEEKKGE